MGVSCLCILIWLSFFSVSIIVLFCIDGWILVGFVVRFFWKFVIVLYIMVLVDMMVMKLFFFCLMKDVYKLNFYILK